MERVISEGREAPEDDLDYARFDCGLIGAGLRTEHYELAGYLACVSIAKTLGMEDVVDYSSKSRRRGLDSQEHQEVAKRLFKAATQ